MKIKFITSLIFAFVVLTGQAQTFTAHLEDSIDFIISGTTTSQHDSVAAFPCAPHGEIKKFPIVDGAFTVTGRLPRHTFLQIGDNIGNDLYFIINETPTKVNLVTGEIKGSALQEEFIRIQLHERDIEADLMTWWYQISDNEKARLYDMYEGELDDATPEDSARFKKFKATMDKRMEFVRQIVRDNQDNVIPAWYLFVNHNNLSYEEMQEFIRDDAPYARHPAMESPWRSYWQQTKQMRLTGNHAPDFEAIAPDGTRHKLSEYLGKKQYVLIDFWTSWCGPCIGSFPFLKKLYSQYHDRGLCMIGVSGDKERNAWLNALERHQLPWISLLSSDKAENDALKLYNVEKIPTTILISPEGKIIATDISNHDLKRLLQQLLGDMPNSK